MFQVLLIYFPNCPVPAPHKAKNQMKTLLVSSLSQSLIFWKKSLLFLNATFAMAIADLISRINLRRLLSDYISHFPVVDLSQSVLRMVV